MFAQLAHGRGVENVRARFGPIECEQADAIVTNLALNHRTCGHCWHYHQFVIVSVKFQARNDCSWPVAMLKLGRRRERRFSWSAKFSYPKSKARSRRAILARCARCFANGRRPTSRR